MERCQQQLEHGLPPCPEIEEEWRGMLRDKKRRQRDKEERERVNKHTGTHSDHWSETDESTEGQEKKIE